MFGHIPLVLADVHVIQLGFIVRLLLDHLSNAPVCIDPVAIKHAIDGPEAALFCLVSALQYIDHIPVGM